jgi:hypothetical protein
MPELTEEEKLDLRATIGGLIIVLIFVAIFGLGFFAGKF